MTLFERHRYYILEGREVKPVDDLLTWARWFEHGDRAVAGTSINLLVLNVDVSTVCLGLDHSWNDFGPPLLFETMVFGGALDGQQERCSTYEQAEAMHAAMVARVKNPIEWLRAWQESLAFSLWIRYMRSRRFVMKHLQRLGLR